ncbi:hypothetical protein OQA88_682 [Cercophora sp. LCS_1]
MSSEPLEARNFFPALQRNVTPTPSGSTVISYTSDLGTGPILTLIHGYPQSAFIWRHIVPLLSSKISLFIPELPGYGVSTPLPQNDKTTVGTALLSALTTVFSTSPESPRPLILAGHDRGARICHRLVVSHHLVPSSLELVGTVLLDIIPTKAQWDAFQNPAVARGYFHWPFLANVDIAVKMLKAYGGDQWARDAHERLMGSSAEARANVARDDAVEVYAGLFNKEETLRGSCEDYYWGCAPEAEEQDGDQKAGRKIGVPAFVMFAEEKLGRTVDVPRVWKDWVDGGKLEVVGLGEGVGHYLPEEAPGRVAEEMVRFLGRVGAL